MSDPHDETATARRSRLAGLKLRALVSDHLGVDDADEVQAFAPGAALVHDDAAWVMLDDRPGRRLGPALAWALRSGARSLDVIADVDTGLLARRAGEFAFPIGVWHADARTLLPAVAEPTLRPSEIPAAHAAFVDAIVAGGADPVTEHGVLIGEVRGLEVCRVVDDPTTGEPRLEVGVGAHDREAFQMLHGETPTTESLARIVGEVAQHRAVGAPRHPLNRLGAERLIRWRLQQAPETVGAISLAPAAPPVARANLKDSVPCVAIGTDADGRRVVAVCAVGVDLDLIPYAADARRSVVDLPGVDADGLRLVVATPSRDRVRVTDELAGLLRQSVEFVSVD